jgi:hypothetical protein
MLEGRRSPLTMSSEQSVAPAGGDVNGRHFLLKRDFGTKATVVSAHGWRLASGPKFLCSIESEKTNFVSLTLPSPNQQGRARSNWRYSESDDRVQLRRHNTKLTASVVTGDTSWPSPSSLVSALRQKHPNNYCYFWPKRWSSSVTRASTSMNSDTLSRKTAAWFEYGFYSLIQIEPTTYGPIRSFTQSTLSRKQFSANQVLAPRGDPRHTTRLKFPANSTLVSSTDYIRRQ